MVDYVRLAETAKQLLTDNGRTLTFTRDTSTGFNPATGVNSITTTNFTGIGAGFDYRRSEIDGEVIQAGDVRIVLEDATTKPLIGDRVLYNGSDYRVMNVDEVSPAGIVVIYKLQVRR